MSDTPESTAPDPSTTSAPAPGNEQAAEINSEIEALRAQLQDAENRAQAAREAQLRAMAELDNVRKRADREIQNAAKFGLEKLLGELVGVCDSLELGLQAAQKADANVATIVEGMQLTRKQLTAVLEKHGVSEVNPVGQPFNPDFHEAMSMVPSTEVPPNHVLSVMQKGYRLHDRLLRPAMVVVARAP